MSAKYLELKSVATIHYLCCNLLSTQKTRTQPSTPKRNRWSGSRCTGKI
jgi:hypothetical protein